MLNQSERISHLLERNNSIISFFFLLSLFLNEHWCRVRFMHFVAWHCTVLFKNTFLNNLLPPCLCHTNTQKMEAARFSETSVLTPYTTQSHITDDNLHILKRLPTFLYWWGTAVVQWLRYCATNRKVAGSIPEGVIEFFHWHNPSDHTKALGSTQPLTEMSTRSISWG
jgi:hypothetical protein